VGERADALVVCDVIFTSLVMPRKRERESECVCERERARNDTPVTFDDSDGLSCACVCVCVYVRVCVCVRARDAGECHMALLTAATPIWWTRSMRHLYTLVSRRALYSRLITLFFSSSRIPCFVTLTRRTPHFSFAGTGLYRDPARGIDGC